MASIPLHCVLVPLSNRPDTWAIISPEDADVMIDRRWGLTGAYVRCDYKMREHTLLHREVMERKLGRSILPGMHIDHINGNPLDNRRSNLREVTPLQNQFNKRVQRQTISGYKGVAYDKRQLKRQWIARIRHNGKQYTIGYYATPEEAAHAYDEKAVIYHQGYAKLNFPEDQGGGG